MIIGVLASDNTNYLPLPLNYDQSTALKIATICILIFAYMVIIANLFVKFTDLLKLQTIKQTHHWAIKTIGFIIFISTIFQLFFMKNEVNQTIIEMCSHKYSTNMCIYLIIYSILISLTIIIKDSKISIALITLLFIIFQIVVWKILLLSPLYQIFGSYFTFILDNERGLYFYQPQTLDNNYLLGSNVILNIHTNGNEIKSVDCSIKLSAYDINGQLTNTDGLGYIKLPNNPYIVTSEGNTKEMLDKLLSRLSYFADINYDTITIMEKSGTILKNEDITSIFEIKKHPILQIFFRDQLTIESIINILYTKIDSIIYAANNNQFYKSSFSQGSDEKFYIFFAKEILYKVATERDVPIEQLAILMNNLPKLIYRIPLHIKQIYGDKKDTWQEISFGTSSSIIDIYIYLRNLEISHVDFIRKDNWNKFR